MPDLVEIKKEILQNIKTKDDQALAKIHEELDLMEVTEGLNDKNNLQNFYDIWIKNKEHIGHKNEINSWTAFYLGMTKAKPDGEFLQKRRAFARAGFPDIDSDFDYFRRQEIYDYIIEKYGRENVGNIGTYGGLKLKSAIRRIGKALDIAGAFNKGPAANVSENEAKVTEIVNSLPIQRGAVLKTMNQQGEEVAIKTIQDAYKYCPDFKQYIDNIPNFLEHAKNIEGIVSNFSIHAAGVVISNVPLSEIAPLRTSNKGLATQFPYEDLESIGLIKFDILAISTLTVIQKTIKMIKENYGIDIDVKNLPLDDAKTFELYKSGHLSGVFQCENKGMQETIQEIEADCFSDIMAAIALYRPGPMASIPEYCARKKGLKSVEYFHPALKKHVKKYLDNTYGILCIQEDTLISMADGSHKPIKDVKKGDRVISVNGDTLSTEVDICHGCAPTKISDGVYLELDNGYSITLTKDHKILTFDGMKEAKDLSDSDIIACPEYICKGHSTLPKKHIRKMLGAKDVDIAYLFGFLTGDGCLSSSSASICCETEMVADKLSQWIKDSFRDIHTTKYFHCRAWYIAIYSNDIIDWRNLNQGNRKTRFRYVLDQHGLTGSTCYNKRIPSYIYNSPQKVQVAFLTGLIESDGHLPFKVNTKSVHITSVNKMLLEDIRHLCSLLGLITSIGKNRIHIYNHDCLKSLITPYLKFKTSNLLSLQGKKVGKVPVKEIINVFKRDGISERRFTQKYNIERSILHKEGFIETGTARRAGLFYGDLRFYSIRKIKDIKEAQFYGMSVAKNHNLIGNGIVISNCYQEQVMQICNVLAGFSVTDGYIMIKGIGKKKQHIIDKFKVQFIDGCSKNGLPERLAKEYWEKFITPFALYGFNAAHCLDGRMRVKDKKSGNFYFIEDLYRIFNTKQKFDIVLDSYIDGDIVEDSLVDVFETGEQDIYEVKLSNGIVLKCTLKHKFLCSDEVVRTLKEIMEGNYEILYEYQDGVTEGVSHNGME